LTKDALRWYVVQTGSGKERAVCKDIMLRAEHEELLDSIVEALVPTEIYKEKNSLGKEVEKEKVISPGYVYVKMRVTDQTWFVIRQTPNVTGVLGSSGQKTKPVPVSNEDMKTVFEKAGKTIKSSLDEFIGRKVKITSPGLLENQILEVTSVDNDKQKLKVMIEIFGTASETELSLTDVILIQE
jgi:transcriptional antiterminator NusG